MSDSNSNVQSSDQENPEKFYYSRVHKTMIGVRLPAQKVEVYKMWCFVNKVKMQDAIEQAMDQLTRVAANQSTTYQHDDLDDIRSHPKTD
jgi:hypothetical protein